MAICEKCGNKVADGVKFCTSCGASMAGKPFKVEVQTEEIQADPDDAAQHKGMAALAYILFFIPLLTGDHKKSPFVMYHTNQGLILFLFSICASTISGILIATVILAILGIPLLLAVSIFSLVLFIIGIMNVMNARMKPLPLIGKFTILK